MMAGMEVILVPAGLLGLAVFAVTIWASVRILYRTGHSGWWVLASFVPVLNIALIWVLALQRWPNDGAEDSAGANNPGPDEPLWSPESLKNAGTDTAGGNTEPPTALPPAKS